jgi:acetyltransferase-like isoleucine patch superfamily enzyme
MSLRFALRKLLGGVAVVLTAPLWLPARLEGRVGRREGIFTGCSELLSLVPGLVGVYLRRGYFRMTLERCGWDCHIGFATTIAHPQVRIGDGVYIGNRCTLGKVVIDDRVAIGSNVDILSGRYQHHFDRTDAEILDQGGTFHPVHIGRNSWVGNSAVVMADIGNDCVIGAGSVVVKPIPPYAVAVGNPAAVKKWRGEPAGDKSPVLSGTGEPTN